MQPIVPLKWNDKVIGTASVDPESGIIRGIVDMEGLTKRERELIGGPLTRFSISEISQGASSSERPKFRLPGKK